MCRSAQQLAHQPACLSRLSRPPACRPARLPRLDSAWPCSAHCGSTWLGSGSARCLGSGLQARPGLALDRVQPGPGLAPKVVVSRTQDSNHGVTEAKKFKKYGAEKIQQQSRNSAGLGLAVAQPSSARPSSTCPASARPGPAQVRAAQLRSSPFSSAQLASAQLGLDTAPTHPLNFFGRLRRKGVNRPAPYIKNIYIYIYV